MLPPRSPSDRCSPAPPVSPQTAFGRPAADPDRGDRVAIADGAMPVKAFVMAGYPDRRSQDVHHVVRGLFTEEIKDLIAEAAARPRVVKPNDVIVLGHGALRAMRVDGRFKIIGISVPPVSKKVRGARRGTTVVSFRTGESSAAYTGTLADGEHEQYVVRASRNELLDVRVDRVRGRDIVARVFEAATRTAIAARAREGTRVWTGRLPATGDYLIDIVRTAPPGEAVLTYWLTVSVR